MPSAACCSPWKARRNPPDSRSTSSARTERPLKARVPVPKRYTPLTTRRRSGQLAERGQLLTAQHTESQDGVSILARRNLRHVAGPSPHVLPDVRHVLGRIMAEDHRHPPQAARQPETWRSQSCLATRRHRNSTHGFGSAPPYRSASRSARRLDAPRAPNRGATSSRCTTVPPHTDLTTACWMLR